MSNKYANIIKIDFQTGSIEKLTCLRCGAPSIATMYLKFDEDCKVYEQTPWPLCHDCIVKELNERKQDGE